MKFELSKKCSEIETQTETKFEPILDVWNLKCFNLNSRYLCLHSMHTNSFNLSIENIQMLSHIECLHNGFK